jgi:hypothetical protein
MFTPPQKAAQKRIGLVLCAGKLICDFFHKRSKKTLLLFDKNCISQNKSSLNQPVRGHE